VFCDRNVVEGVTVWLGPVVSLALLLTLQTLTTWFLNLHKPRSTSGWSICFGLGTNDRPFDNNYIDFSRR
jgi:hypothetical protein